MDVETVDCNQFATVLVLKLPAVVVKVPIHIFKSPRKFFLCYYNYDCTHFFTLTVILRNRSAYTFFCNGQREVERAESSEPSQSFAERWHQLSTENKKVSKLHGEYFCC